MKLLPHTHCCWFLRQHSGTVHVGVTLDWPRDCHGWLLDRKSVTRRFFIVFRAWYIVSSVRRLWSSLISWSWQKVMSWTLGRIKTQSFCFKTMHASFATQKCLGTLGAKVLSLTLQDWTLVKRFVAQVLDPHLQQMQIRTLPFCACAFLDRCWVNNSTGVASMTIPFLPQTSKWKTGVPKESWERQTERERAEKVDFQSKVFNCTGPSRGLQGMTAINEAHNSRTSRHLVHFSEWWLLRL